MTSGVTYSTNTTYATSIGDPVPGCVPGSGARSLVQIHTRRYRSSGGDDVREFLPDRTGGVYRRLRLADRGGL